MWVGGFFLTYAAQTPIIVVVQPHRNSGATTNMNDTKMTDKQLITTLIALLERNAEPERKDERRPALSSPDKVKETMNMQDIKQVIAKDITIGSFIPVGDGIVERVELVLTNTDKGTTEILFGTDLTRLEILSNEQLRCILH